MKDILPEIAITEEIFKRHFRLTGVKITVKFEHESELENPVSPKQS